MAPIRYPTRFENADADVTAFFRTVRLEYEPTQDLRSPTLAAAGRHYSSRLLTAALRSSPSIKENGRETIRFLQVEDDAESLDAAIDALTAACLEIGFGKLWSIGADGSERWCWAEIDRMPSRRLAVENRRHMPLELQFQRFSDWYAAESYGLTVTLDAVSMDVTVTNSGLAAVYNAVIIVRGTFDHVVIYNQRTSEQLESLSVGSDPNDWLRFDCARGSYEISDDGGATYDLDFANAVLQGGQIQLMTFLAGDNILTISADPTPDAFVAFGFYPAFHT